MTPARAVSLAGFAVALALGLAAMRPLSSRADGGEGSAWSASSLEIRGSGAMGQLARSLAEQFMSEHPGTTVTVQTCGGHQALKALIIGTADLAMGTDEIPEELEKLSRDTGVKLKRTDVYRDAVEVVVHPTNPVRNLSSRQIRDIFRGAISNWKEVGGPDAPIEVLTVSSTSAAYEVFKRRVLGSDAVMTPRATVVGHRQMKESLGPFAIAYAGMSQVGRQQLQAVTVDGIGATAQTVSNGQYPIVRHMSVYQREPSTALADQVVASFLAPAQGQKLVLQAGNVPVN
ncbi:MAG: phosphate ABC transporter substrate-binding protein [Deltaproteobacteria bacterium]|nr:phosphate ABC transporter substrate-binding protein [Deltaproteobacteria bacterium]